VNTHRLSEATIAYYDQHAEEFVRDTLGVDMSALYEPFLALLPPGGHILDAGCGSGRDALAFKSLGYAVTAFDASPVIAQLATEVIGQSVEVLRLQDMKFDETFDGVWACASLLHVPGSELDAVLSLLTYSLCPGGVLFMSFKWGESEEVRNGRLFNSHTADSLARVLSAHSALAILNLWQTSDQRPGRQDERWVNALVRRTSAG
jgi:SAM-dependent methyltransferase